MCDSDRWPMPPYHPEDYWLACWVRGSWRDVPVRVRATVLVAAMAIGVSTCGDDPVGVEDIPGVWEAISVNGSPVPGFVTINVGTGEEARSVRYDLYTFLDGGTCKVVLNYSQGELSHEFCRWELGEDAGTITIVLSAGGLDWFLPGVVNGALMTVTMPNEGGDPNIHVYRKQ